MERNAVGAVNIATHWCSAITRQNAGAPYGAPQLSWFSRSPVYLFASHHIVGASTARMTIRHPDEPCRAGVFSALRLCHYPHSLGCSPPKHGSLRLLQAVTSDKLLPRRRASNVAAFGAANGDFSGLVEVGDGRFRCRLNG
jgi:hypothetical protein